MFHHAIWLALLLCSTIATPTDIIIIGAGPSGIAAATRLLENKVTDFIVLEAENRIGGRVNTIKFGANVQDLGGQWCHGEVNNVVFEMAQPLGLLEPSNYTFDNFNYVNAKGEFLSNKLNEINAHFNEFSELQNAPLNTTVGDYFIQVYNEYVKKFNLDVDEKAGLLELLHLKQLVMEASNSWFELPIKASQAYEELEGNQMNSWKGRGYKTILDVMMKKIPDPSKELPLMERVLLNKEVENLNWDNENNQVQIKCKDGSKYSAKRVIVTTSLGVLKAQHHTLFTPELPLIKRNAIKSIGFGVVDKIIFEFPHQWWPEKSNGFFIIWSKLGDANPELLDLLRENDWLRDIPGCHPYDYQPNNLLCWILRDSARKMETIPEDIVKEKVLKLMRLLLASHYTIPDPKSFIRSQWDSNPHFRGSYSYNSVAMEELNITTADLAAPVSNSKNVGVLLFAGEATSFARYSTVHGAIETGWREADRILIELTEKQKL